VHRRAVITGLGSVTPCGLDVAATWDAMLHARSGITRITRFDTAGFRSQIAGEVKGFDGEARFGRRAIRRLGLFMQYALVAGEEALTDAGFRKGEVWPEPERFGTYVGTGIGGFPEVLDAYQQLDEGGVRHISALFITRTLSNLAAGMLAIENQAKGPSLCVSTACAVGNHSIGEAVRALLFGDADVILARGTEASLNPLGFGGFMNMKALSTRNDDPAGASRPFDRDRDGFVMAEGAGVVVLEELEHALRRGARIYCEVIGYGSTTDAYHVTAPAPGGDGAARCMARAMEVARIAAEEVDYINAHGTSTPLNDPTECAAIRTVFGDHADKVAVSSTKGVTGHTLGAAGGVEAVATAMTLYTGQIPPTANLENPDPECDVDLVRGEARVSHPRIALSNGFGFGGTNGTLVFARWEG
jgi:3-oxoacyl-[acyl-carrier-protein] synthase II